MKKVLVVDDDSDLLNSVQSILKGDGYETNVIAEWDKVYRQVRAFDPDLIILDIQLQGLDGRLICQTLKHANDTCHIPIIMISSHSFAESSVRDYGADCFLAKPFSIDNLLKEVKQYAGTASEGG